MNDKIIVTGNDYDKIDGRNAYNSSIKKLTLGAPLHEENKSMEMAVQMWKENANGEEELHMEVPFHQVMDMMIFLSRTLLYFRDAYRFPLLYDPENPTVDRVGIQGGVLPIEISTENPNIDQDIQSFSQALNDIGEITGDRFRVLSRILEELEY